MAVRSNLLRPAAAVFAITFVVYALTAARTITFWDGAHYSLLARTLSISNPPGSLLLTLIGRVLGDLPFAWPMAFRLNLLAALIAAAAAAAVVRLGVRASRGDSPAPRAALAAAGIAGLLFGFAPTVWVHATQFNPYGLSALFTALILLAFSSWWDRAADSDGIASAALVALLFGLDLSAHRANVLLVPAVLAGILLRRPRALLNLRLLAASAGAFAAGAALQLLYIPISRREPFVDLADAHSLAGWWSFERLDPMGGGFLIDLWPRRADFVHVQLADLVDFARANLGAAPWGWIAGAVLALAGLAALARRSPRLAMAWFAFGLATGLGEVVYFNRPAQYFRPLDRHYLPFLVALMPPVAAGIAAALAWTRARAGRAAAILAALLALALPAAAAVANFRDHDLSRTRFAETYARDMLEPLPRGAIVVTNGDNDTFPLWYLQRVEGLRRDVEVLNFGTSASPNGARRVRRLDPALAEFTPSDTIPAFIARRMMARRPTYLAVTVWMPEPIPGISERLQLEGLTYRVATTAADSVASRAALERFQSERLPRAGFGDHRQILADDLRPLAGNYAAAAIRLAYAQLNAGDGRGALATLDRLDRSYPVWGWPPGAKEFRASADSLRRHAEAVARTPSPPHR